MILKLCQKLIENYSRTFTRESTVNMDNLEAIVMEHNSYAEKLNAPLMKYL